MHRRQSIGASGPHERVESGDPARRARTGVSMEYVRLSYRANRGWPWPDDSFGLTPMYGNDGWCRSCGIPKRPQSGSLVLRRRGLTGRSSWVPNWLFDVICLEQSVADELVDAFDIPVRKIEWKGRGSGPREASQIVAPTVGESWFSEAELAEATARHHGPGRTGARCLECGVWRWYPLVDWLLPPLRIRPGLGNVPVAASPEWFGDGLKAFREILIRRDLAESLVQSSNGELGILEIGRLAP